MKRNLVVMMGWLMSVALLAGFANANEEGEEGGFSGSLGIAVADKYHSDDGFDYSNGKAVYQPDLFLAYDMIEWGQVSLEFWGSYQFDGVLREEFANEIDYIVSWQKDFEFLTVQVGFNYIDCATLFDGTTGDVAEWILELSREFSLTDDGDTFAPFVRVEWNHLIGEGDTSSNFFVGMLHGHSFTEQLSLNNRIAIVLDDGKDTEAGAVGLLQSMLSYALRENVSIDLLGKVTTPVVDAEDRDTVLSALVGITLSF